MPLARTGRATAVVGGKIITVGGTLWAPPSPQGQAKIWTAAVSELDPQANSWRALPDYPLPAGDAFAVGIGSRLFVIGGRGESRGNPEVYILDLAGPNLRWIAGPSLPHPRWAASGASVQGKIYLVGGVEGDPLDRSKPAGDVLLLDPAHIEGGWNRIAQLPQPSAEWPMVAAAGDSVYLFGGLRAAPHDTDKGYLPEAGAFALKVDTGQWRNIAQMPLAIGSGAAVAVNSRQILIVGGYALAIPANSTPDGKARTYYGTQCLLYDSARDRYRGCSPIPLAVVDQGLAYSQGHVFVIAGEDSPYRTRTDLVQVGTLQ